MAEGMWAFQTIITVAVGVVLYLKIASLEGRASRAANEAAAREGERVLAALRALEAAARAAAASAPRRQEGADLSRSPRTAAMLDVDADAPMTKREIRPLGGELRSIEEEEAMTQIFSGRPSSRGQPISQRAPLSGALTERAPLSGALAERAPLSGPLPASAPTPQIIGPDMAPDSASSRRGVRPIAPTLPSSVEKSPSSTDAPGSFRAS